MLYEVITDDWVARLTTLLRDAPLRARVGASARRWIEEHYNLARYRPRLADYVNAVARGREVAA